MAVLKNNNGQKRVKKIILNIEEKKSLTIKNNDKKLSLTYKLLYIKK